MAITNGIARPESRPVTRQFVWPPSAWLALGFLAVLILPSASYVAHGLVTAWLLFPVWLLVLLLENPRLIQRAYRLPKARLPELLMFAGWLLIVLFNWLLERGYTGQLHVEVATTVAMLILMDLAYSTVGGSQHQRLTTAVFLLVGIEVVRSLPVLWSSPLLVRQVMLQGAAAPGYAVASLAGVGVYGFYTGCAIASPVLFATAMGAHGWRRVLLLVLMAAVGAAVILASLLGAVLLMALGFLVVGALAFWSMRQKSRVLWGLLLIVSLAILAWMTVFSQTAPGRLIGNKVVLEIASIREHGLIEGDITGRTTLWLSSIRTFADNPLFGIGPTSGTQNPYLGSKVGGHSSLFDLPAEYGLAGLVFYGVFLLSVVWRVWVDFRRNPRSLLSQARVASCALLLLGGAYNPVIFQMPINALFFVAAVGNLAPVVRGDAAAIR